MIDVCWTAFNKRLVFAWKSSEKPDWRENGVKHTVEAYDAWDRKMRRKYGALRSIRWFGQTNEPQRRTMIASLHWPHRLCWSWFLDWSVVHPECRGFKVTCAYSQFAIVLWCRQISFHWQNDNWMVGMQHRDEGPEVIWKHDIERAMYLERRSKQAT